jgi:hypothetical protein
MKMMIPVCLVNGIDLEEQAARLRRVKFGSMLVVDIKGIQTC